METRARSSDSSKRSSLIASAGKARVLAFSDWYLPGCKGGGAVSAISNLIELLGDEFEFHVFTRNRDNTEDRPYDDIGFDQWAPVGKAKVFYASELSIRNILRRIREVDPHVVYLNSFFSRLTIKTLVLRKCGLLPRSAVVLAPRGEFSPGALELNFSRKWLYRKLAFASGLYRNLVWQASSKLEEEHIRSSSDWDGRHHGTNVLIARDAPSTDFKSHRCASQILKKESGTVRLIFLSRISRKKNLHFALELLGSAQGKVELNIYGPVDDRAYWAQCQARIRKLGDHVRVAYKGAVSSDQVLPIFSQCHFQILPTLGENFGYAILEALAAGCPVIISDQTPWEDLEKQGVGWTLPLDDAGRWDAVLEQCVAMDAGTYAAMSARARHYAREWILSTPFHVEHRRLFREAVQGFPNARIAERSGFQPL